MPLVRPGSPRAALHVLFGLVCARMAPPHRPWLSSGAGSAARPGHLRDMPDRHSGCLRRTAALAWDSPAKASREMGAQAAQPQDSLGRRSYPARGGRRRRVRPSKSANPVPALPPAANPGAEAQAPGLRLRLAQRVRRAPPDQSGTESRRTPFCAKFLNSAKGAARTTGEIRNRSRRTPFCASSSIAETKHPLLLALDRALREPFERRLEQKQVILFPHSIMRGARQIDKNLLG